MTDAQLALPEVLSPPQARVWSAQQLAVFTFFLSLRPGVVRNLVVRARAGTGKTTTIVEAVCRLLAAQPHLSVVVSSFAKEITEEMRRRITSPGATVKGLHSLGFSYILPHWRGVSVDGDRGKKIAREVCTEFIPVPATAYGPATTVERLPPPAILAAVAKLAGLAKNIAPMTSTREVLRQIGLRYEVFPTDTHGYSDDYVINHTLAAMERAKLSDGTIDFDDMLFLPLALDLVRAKYDVVVVDEAQDTNAAQLLIAQRSCRPGGSMVVVGDDRQAIYAFRGADVGSLDRMKAESNATELPLTVTYRCGQSIVRLAQRLVPDFEAAESNPEGIVRHSDVSRLLGEVRGGDFILSRKNAPLMALCLQLLRNGVKAKIVGRDVGAALATLVKKLARRDGSTAGLLASLENWERKQVETAVRLDNENRANEARDRAEVICTLCEEVETVPEVLAKIEALFADLKAGQPIKSVVLSSVHKAKGLEADRVFILTDTLYPGKGGKDSLEEANIHYVALTRAKAELVLVEGEV